MHYQSEAQYMYEQEIGDDIEDEDSFDLLKDVYKKELSQATDKKIVDKLLHHHYAKDYINNIVPNRRFPAYTIAESIRKRGYKMSVKQRQALINVLAHCLASVG